MMTDDEYHEYLRPYREAEKKLAAALRDYLWDMVRITGSPEWETDPDFILIAVMRVAVEYLCCQKFEMEEVDNVVIPAVEDLVVGLDELLPRRNA